MTEIEQKAQALVDEVILEVSSSTLVRFDPYNPTLEAVRRAIEQHEAFRQEVSDALLVYQKADGLAERSLTWDALTRFILPKPVDPLVEAWLEAFPGNHIDDAREECAKISAALAARGLEIREVE